MRHQSAKQFDDRSRNFVRPTSYIPSLSGSVGGGAIDKSTSISGLPSSNAKGAVLSNRHYNSSPVMSPVLSPSSQSSSPLSASEEAIRCLMERIVPSFFDYISKYQFNQALIPLQREPRNKWKQWNAFNVMLRLLSSCESTYHLMKYLEEDTLNNDTITKMYRKLSIVMRHISQEITPASSTRRRFLLNGGVEDDEESAQVLICGELDYYAELFDQCAEFFLLRCAMISVYKGLAMSRPPHDYSATIRSLNELVQKVSVFDHPLLEIVQRSALEEIKTVQAALSSEQAIASYEFTTSIISLHKVKQNLRSWSNHLDTLSDYPHVDTELEEEEEEEEESQEETHEDQKELPSESTYSHSATTAAVLRPFHSASEINSSSLPTSMLNRFRRKSLPADIEITSHNILCRSPSVITEMTIDDTEEPGTSTTATAAARGNLANQPHNTLSRLLLQKACLKKHVVSSISGSVSMRNLMMGLQKSPINQMDSSVMPMANGTTGGVFTTETSLFPLDTEMSDQGNEGYTLPSFQWSKRLYGSLIAKFTLYFSRWLDPFEKKTAFVPSDLTRFVRNPFGMSYMQLMDSLLAKGATKPEDGSLCIMLVLETQKLENKGVHYHRNGYLCPRKTISDVSATTPRVAGVPRVAGAQPVVTTPSHHRSHRTFIADSKEILDSNSPEGQSSLFMSKEHDDGGQTDFSPLWGLGMYPAVFCYPCGEPPMEHWPNIVSLIMDSRQAIEAAAPMFTHHEKRIKASYHISRIDPCMYLVLSIEGKRRPNEKAVQDFMLTITDALQHTTVFQIAKRSIMLQTNSK